MDGQPLGMAGCHVQVLGDLLPTTDDASLSRHVGLHWCLERTLGREQF